MKYLLEVCLISISMTLSGTPPVTAQSASSDAVPVLRKGISVDLPRATSAISVPSADKEDALVVTIEHKGSTYFGTSPIGIDDLPGQLKDVVSKRKEKNVYVKADARAPYASIINVLDSLHAAGIEGVTLLTSQPGAITPGTVVSPVGLPIQIIALGVGGRSSNLY